MEKVKERFFHKIIRALCEEMGIKMEKLSYNWILQLSKDGKIRYITDYLFDNNSQAAGEIVNDKYATYEVLKSQNIPVVKHTMIFNPKKWGEFTPKEGNEHIIKSEFEKYKKIVVKPNNECEGIGIALCDNLKKVQNSIQNLFDNNHASISICPYYNIKKEYRTFYLNGEVLLIYGKTKPFVIGDGKSTVKELVETLHLPNKEIIKDNLSKLDMNYVPKEKEKIEISWKHNLSGGAIPTLLEKNKLYEKIEKIAIKAGEAININFATIDIIQTQEDKLYVMEINSGICSDIFANKVEGGLEIVKNIYRKAIEAMF